MRLLKHFDVTYNLDQIVMTKEFAKDPAASDRSRQGYYVEIYMAGQAEPERLESAAARRFMELLYEASRPDELDYREDG